MKFYHYHNEKDICNTISHEDSYNHVSRFLRKWLNVENFNVLIGSGCSTPAIPLMNTTFKEIIKNEDIYNENTYQPFKESKKNQLEQKGISQDQIEYELIKTMNIEEYLDWLNQAILFHENIDDDKQSEFKRTFDYTVKKLANSMKYEVEEYLTNEDYKKTLQLYISFYQNLFQARSKTQKIGVVNVFTSNYDLFNEVALEELNIHYTTGFKGGVIRKFNPSMFSLRLVDDENRYKEKWDPVRKFVKLYKIHGSLNWIENERNEIIQSVVTSNSLEKRMIYPYVSKHNLTRQTPYSELFREFSINLQKPNSVLFVMGYGFPDEHINQIIKQGIDNPDLTIIIFGNKSDQGLKQFLENTRSAQNIHTIGGIDQNHNYNGHYFYNIIKLLCGDNYDGI